MDYVHLFSWRNCSTSWSRLMSSLPRLLRPRRGLDEGPAAAAFSARRRCASSRRSQTLSGTWTSSSLPCLAGCSVTALMDDDGPVRDGTWWGSSPSSGCDAEPCDGAVRLDRRDSIYSVLR